MPTSKKKKGKDTTTSKVWVYSGTAVPYTQSFNISDLINITMDNKSGSIQGDLQKPDGTSDRIEFITKDAQTKREGTWVYAGTGISFPENVNVANLTNTITDKKSGWITQGTLQTSDGVIHKVEFITKSTQKKREEMVWVYANTSIPFPENVNLSNLTNTATDKKSGWITKGTLQTSDGATHQVEFITKKTQKQREGIWVYAGTGISFPENVNLSNLTNTTTNKKSGRITKGTLQKPDGTTHQVEFITKTAQLKRTGMWVYAGTSIPFPEKVNLSTLTNTTTDKKSSWITQGTLQTSDGEAHQIEFITKGAQTKREGIWVYANTSIPFPENVNLSNLTNTTTDKKNGWITKGTLQTSDGEAHQVEFITKNAQSLRKGIWVYANTGVPYPEDVNLSNLTNTTTDKKSGWITKGTLQTSDGSTHQVEFITKNAQKLREGIWVYAGTGIHFPEKVNLSNLTNTTTDKKSGRITKGTLQTSDGSTHRIEFITITAQKEREGIWVYASTCIPFPENVSLENLINTTTDKKSGRITKGTFQTSDGNIHQVEFITKSIQRQRSKRQLDQASADVSINTTRTHGLFQSPVTDPSKQLEKNDQNKPHKRVKR